MGGFTGTSTSFGGEPFGVLIGDYEFSHHSQDVALLEKISAIAAAAHAPFIAAASPQLFGCHSFTEIGNLRDLTGTFRGAEHSKWNLFRETADSRYVALTLPRVLMRSPYGSDETGGGIQFSRRLGRHGPRGVSVGQHSVRVGTRLTDAFARYGWCVAIRGVEGGGLVEGLPTHTFKTEDGGAVLKCPTEIALPDRREHELSSLGFIALVHHKGTDQAAFVSSQTCQRPRIYAAAEATAAAQLFRASCRT